jgi:uncharacterized membrane protein YfcA
MSIGLIIAVLVVGLVTGTVTSLVGASGVSVIVPALTLFFGLNSHLAIGTSLMVDVITSIFVAIGYFHHGNVRLRAGLWITIGSIVGAQIGSHWAGIIPDGPLNTIFAVVLILSGIATLRRKSQVVDTNKGLHLANRFLETLLLLTIGFGIGIISGLVGAGGGVMVLLTIIFILHYPMHQAVGTSTVIMAITALSSMVGYARQGNVDWRLGIIISIGAVIAGTVGARFANTINEAKLNRIVAWIFILLGLMMVGVRLI